MKLRHIALMLLALPLTSTVQAQAQKIENQIQFITEVVKEVEKDEIQVSFYVQEEGKDAKALNQIIVERINRALDLVKKQETVQIVSQQRYTQVRYDKDGKQNGWIDRAELVLKSKDNQTLSQLTSQLSENLKISSMYATVSQESLDKVEEEMTAAVLKKFEQKAQSIQSLMKAKSYRVIELNLATNDVMGSSKQYAVAMRSSDKFYNSYSDDEMALEGGKTQLKASVQARIELVND